MQDYWSPGRIIDTYHEELTSEDVDEIQKTNSISKVDDAQNIDERSSMVYAPAVGDEANTVDQMIYFAGAMGRTFSNYYDGNGNIRVLRVRWKSLRKIKKLKYYNETTGEEEFTFMPEDYVADKSRGRRDYGLLGQRGVGREQRLAKTYMSICVLGRFNIIE